MSDGILLEKKSIQIEGLGNADFHMTDPASRELFGDATERQMPMTRVGWVFNTLEQISDGEKVTVFESSDAMRFGPRYYSDEQFKRIHRATTERAEPIAPPIPLDG